MAADPLKNKEADNKRTKLKKEKPYVYEKVMKFEEKLKIRAKALPSSSFNITTRAILLVFTAP